MPDPIRNVLVMASYGHYGQLAARIGPDRICQIRLLASVSVPFFQRRHGSDCAKLTRIQSGWPCQGLAKHIWSGSKLVCRNHRARFLAECNRSGTSFPLPDSVLFFHRRNPDNTEQKQLGSEWVLADYVRFWPNGSGPEASRCARITRPTSGPCFQADPDRMRIGSGMFTGKVTRHSVQWDSRCKVTALSQPGLRLCEFCLLCLYCFVWVDCCLHTSVC